MASPARLARVLLDRRTPVRTRLGLLMAGARRLLRPRPVYSVPYGRASVLLSHADYAIDRKSFEFVVTDGSYATDYAGAVVLDIGAHKGYFARMRSPTVLARSSRSSRRARTSSCSSGARRRSGRWGPTGRCGLPQSAPRAARQSYTSWQAPGDTRLHPPDSFAEYKVGVQRVPVEAMAKVLAEVSARAGNSPVVVKLNIEGEECETVLGTPADAWERVSELLVETHPWATCDADRLAAHLAPAGLIRIASAHRLVLRLRHRT